MHELQISLTNVIRTYTEGYTRSWSRSQAVRFQLSGNARYCELRRPGQELQRSGSKLVRKMMEKQKGGGGGGGGGTGPRCPPLDPPLVSAS